MPQARQAEPAVGTAEAPLRFASALQEDSGDILEGFLAVRHPNGLFAFALVLLFHLH